jgi:hypothetical protein
MFRFMFVIACATIYAADLPPAASSAPTAPARMTVTANVEKGKRTPQINSEDVTVKQGKQRLQVTEWVPAQGDRAGLELFFLIDDASISNLGLQLEYIRAFIKAQPATTLVGVGYARNGTVEVRQDFIADGAKAASALRLPLSSVGAYGSPYLSLASLMKRWAETSNRREVVLVTDGLDRAHRERNALLNPDVDYAANVAQRTGTIVHTIFYPGVGQWQVHYLEAVSGLNALAKLSEITGGETFSLGRHAPVSFAPYLDNLQRILDNQYLLTFSAKPGKKAKLHYVDVSTEIAGADFATSNAVWVPAAK